MKILILGAGAIGTMLGVALAEKNDVTFYVREAKKENHRKWKGFFPRDYYPKPLEEHGEAAFKLFYHQSISH